MTCSTTAMSDLKMLSMDLKHVNDHPRTAQHETRLLYGQ